MKTSKMMLILFFITIFCLTSCEKEQLFPNLETTIQSAVFQQPSSLPSMLISPATTKWIKKKADLKMDEIMEVIEQYYHIPDGGLLELTAYCTNRLDLAILTNIDYELLTLATELQDLKRLGLNNEEAAILLGALFFGIEEANGDQHASLDMEEIRKKDAESLLAYIQLFVREYCVDCSETDIPTLSEIDAWIEKAKTLDLLISYPDESQKCRYGNGSDQVEVSPSNTKWVKKKTD